MSTSVQLDPPRPWPDDIQPISRAGHRIYPIPDVGYLPSITSILDKVLGVWGYFLLNWAATEERKYVLRSVADHFDWAGRDGMTGGQFVTMVEQGIGPAKAAEKKKVEAGDLGTAAHKLIEWRLHRELNPASSLPRPVVPDGAELAYMAWDDWFAASGLKPVRLEQVVWDEEWRWAGRLDHLFEDQAGQLVLGDLKTSNYILAKHHIQVAGYLRAINFWRPVSRGFILRVPKTLEKMEIEVRDVGDMYDPEKKQGFTLTQAELLDVFHACRTLYRILLERDFLGRGKPGS